jgi:K+-transporting ATPase ATPase C chain
MLTELKRALGLFALLTVVTGLVYPGLVTGLAQALMATKANGSLIVLDGKARGSALIGQPFSEPRYFWGRPSATAPQPYNGMASSGSNLGPTNPVLVDAVRDRVAALREADPGNDGPIPQDLVTASASGLDPHISVAAAEYQLPRVARVRGIDEAALRALLAQHTEDRQLWVLGERRVGVLRLNLALDALAP